MSVKIIQANRRRTASAGSLPAAESLIRKLVAQAATLVVPVREKPPNGELQSLLFSAEVDGVRCTLERAQRDPTEEVWLSPRESEIARMIAKGYPNKTIAAVLEISVWTVSTHLRRIFAKLRVNSRAAMVAQMSKGGMLGLLFSFLQGLAVDGPL